MEEAEDGKDEGERIAESDGADVFGEQVTGCDGGRWQRGDVDEDEAEEEENPGSEGENVEEEVAVVVGCDAIVDPGAVTGGFSIR